MDFRYSIEQDDFRENPPKDFFRLAPGRADGSRDVVGGGQLFHGLVAVGGRGRPGLRRALVPAAGAPPPGG